MSAISLGESSSARALRRFIDRTSNQLSMADRLPVLKPHVRRVHQRSLHVSMPFLPDAKRRWPSAWRSETNVPGRDGIEYMAYAAHMDKQRHLDTTFFHTFSRDERRPTERFGASMDDIARVVAKAYGNANRNPQALHRTTRMDYEFACIPSERNYLLDDQQLKLHIRLTDCTVHRWGQRHCVGDGGRPANAGCQADGLHGNSVVWP